MVCLGQKQSSHHHYLAQYGSRMMYTLHDIQQAWQQQDPLLVDYLVSLLDQPEAIPKQPLPAEILTFQRFLEEILSATFRAQPDEVQLSERLAKLAILESSQTHPLPDRFKLHVILLSLWADPNPYARYVLMQAIRRLPLVYGVWKAIKLIFKQAEQRNDYAMLGLIAAQLDMQRHASPAYAVSAATKTYMQLRAWRYLRHLGQQLPVCYPEAAIHYLAEYQEPPSDFAGFWPQAWSLNHILFHCTSNGYGRYHFSVYQEKLFQPKIRAFTEVWLRSAEPLFKLMEMARAEAIRQYACDALKHDFRNQLRDVAITKIQALALIPVSSAARDELLVWLLQGSPQYEQQQFISLGLHAVVIELLESASLEAQAYAISYAKTYAADLDLVTLLRLAENANAKMREFAIELLKSRDPRQAVGLAAWGQLLDSRHHHALAAQQLSSQFNADELDLNWFEQRLHGGQRYSVAFVEQYLQQYHPIAKIPAAYFERILVALPSSSIYRNSANFVLNMLEKLGLKQLQAHSIQILLLHPLTQARVLRWLVQQDYPAQQLPMWYWHALAYQPDWEQHVTFRSFCEQADNDWLKLLSFDPDLAETVRSWLADVRRFVPASLTFDWLLALAQREETYYHDFAVDRIIRAFVPADFALTSQVSDDPSQMTTDDASAVDLQQQSFLFTGKLATMTRAESEQKVTAANGKNATAVNNKLDYLVIGDEGSPMYGNGRKGSKQVKAESLITAGAAIKIISETAFLQMLVGQSRQASQDQSLAGCEVLWQMATKQPNSPLSRLALQYMRYHHPKLCLKLTDRPVDPDAVIPAEFLTLDRFQPLLNHLYIEMRQFALEIAHFELARWSPSSRDVVLLAESRYPETRELIQKALLDPLSAENKGYHLQADTLDPTAVYGLCESRQAFGRQLGMQIVRATPQFQQPQVLFQLTESPEREVRSFAMRLLWQQYRHHATTADWKPHLNGVTVHLGQAKIQQQTTRAQQLGTGLPERPAEWPATAGALQGLLRRWLFELPPARLAALEQGVTLSRKPMPASRAKCALIETCRDLALEDQAFAQLVLPLFETFQRSRAQMEQAACLVAVTRIRHAYPALIRLN